VGEIIIKLLVIQLAVIGVIWTGMTAFFPQMNIYARAIYYIVTSWFLFLIVVVVKEWIRSRKNPK
jgi:type IV secretory pathway VirB2 component (pilin)